MEFFRDVLWSRASPKIALACMVILDGWSSFSLKIRLFLSIHIFQQIAFGIHLQAVWSRIFLDRWNGESFIHFERRSWMVTGRLIPIFSIIASLHTSLEKGQSIRMWFKVSSSFLQRGHRVGPSIPLFLRFSPKRILLWASIQQKMSIFGMKALVQRNF